jgi:hypothetical protein
MRESNIRKKTNATKKYYLLRHQNKVAAMRETTSETKKETNATKKYYLLQQSSPEL